MHVFVHARANLIEPISNVLSRLTCVLFASAPTRQCIKGGCPDGSSWAKHAQEVIGTNITAGWKLAVSNNYVDLGANPLTGGEFHLPVITPNAGARSIGVTTYTQATWDLLDDAGAQCREARQYQHQMKQC